MSKGTVDGRDNNEQLLVELEQLLERQIAAARADDLSTVAKLGNECAERVMAIDHMATIKGHAQRLKQLHCQLECILNDKLALTEQQLCSVQQGQKVLGVYRNNI